MAIAGLTCEKLDPWFACYWGLHCAFFENEDFSLTNVCPAFAAQQSSEEASLFPFMTALSVFSFLLRFLGQQISSEGLLLMAPGESVMKSTMRLEFGSSSS